MSAFPDDARGARPREGHTLCSSHNVLSGNDTTSPPAFFGSRIARHLTTAVIVAGGAFPSVTYDIGERSWEQRCPVELGGEEYPTSRASNSRSFPAFACLRVQCLRCTFTCVPAHPSRCVWSSWRVVRSLQMVLLSAYVSPVAHLPKTIPKKGRQRSVIATHMVRCPL